MIAAGGSIIAGAADVVVLPLEDWSSGAFSDYIFWMDGDF